MGNIFVGGTLNLTINKSVFKPVNISNLVTESIHYLEFHKYNIAYFNYDVYTNNLDSEQSIGSYGLQ